MSSIVEHIITDLDQEAIAADYLGVTIEVLRAAREARVFADSGPKDAVHIPSAVDQFLVALANRRRGRRGLRQSTLDSYRRDLKYFERFLCDSDDPDHSDRCPLPDGYLHEVTDEHVEQWLKQPRQRRTSLTGDLAPGTLDRKIKLLRGLFSYAMKMRWVTDNPAEEFRIDTSGALVPRHLPESGYALLLDRLRPGRNRLMARVLGEAGPRVGALTKLQVKDVILHPHAGCTVDEDPPRLALRDGKGGKDGFAFLWPSLCAALEDFLIEDGLVGHRDHYVFHPRGKPWESLSLSRIEKILAQGLHGIEIMGKQATPHSLRHRFAHRLRNLGVEEPDIQVLLNHSRLETTHIYTVLNLGELHKVVMRYHPLSARGGDPFVLGSDVVSGKGDVHELE